jgi:PAS domain S-box-containing protein
MTWLGQFIRSKWFGPEGVGAPFIVFAAGLLAAGMMWSGILWAEKGDRDASIEDGLTDVQNLATILGEHVSNTLAAAEDTGLEFVDRYLKEGLSFDMAEYRRQRPTLQKHYLSFGVIDAKGELILSDLPLPATPFSFARTEAFRAMADLSSPRVYVGTPRPGSVTGKLSFYVSVRILGPDGTFGGMVSIGMDPAYYSGLYDKLQIGQDSSVVIFGRDGIVRLRQENGKFTYGQDLSRMPRFAELIEKTKEHALAIVSPGGGPFDQKPRLVGFRSLDTHPFGVVVTKTLDTALASHYQYSQRIVVGGAAATALMLVLTIIGVKTAARWTARTAELQESRRRYAQVEKAVRDGIWDWDIGSGVDYLSPQWKAMLGYEDGELKNVVSTFFDLVHPDDRGKIDAAIEAHFREQTPYAPEFRLRKRSGDYLWILARGEALRDDKGTPYRMIGTITDISDRKKSEAALAESEARLSSMIKSAMDAILTVDENMKIVAFNSAAESVFGCAAADAVGHSLERFIPDRFRSAHAGHMRTYAASGGTKRLMGQGAELRVLRANGAEFSAEISIARHSGHDRKYFSAFVRDITERKRSEELVRQSLIELGAAKEAAEVANRAKSAFLANMSHELRTPLNAILGFSEIVATGVLGPISEKYREYGKDILSSGRHLLDVINDILDMSKLEAGRYRLDLRPVDVSKVVAGALRIAEGLAKDKGIRIETAIEPGLPPIEGDERAMKQVLLNLLSNAVKFNRVDGRILVRLSAGSDGALEIRIKDTGIGIAAEDIPNLFQPFQQVGDGHTRRAEGTGLGLWISLQFVTMHGGTLKLESALGVGTEAIVRLPVKSGGARRAEVL